MGGKILDIKLSMSRKDLFQKNIIDPIQLQRKTSDKTFETLCYLKQHVSSHNDFKPFYVLSHKKHECQICHCEKSSKHTFQLRNHLRHNHASQQKSEYKCKICEREQL